jgi:hypothetical protein
MNPMSEPQKQPHQCVDIPIQPEPKVDESGSVNVSGYIKIFDPSTKELLMETRE